MGANSYTNGRVILVSDSEVVFIVFKAALLVSVTLTLVSVLLSDDIFVVGRAYISC